MSDDRLTADEIEAAFEGTNFGPGCKRKKLENALLKRCCWYYNGSTMTRILMDLNLIDADNEPTRRGRSMAYEAFHHREEEAT